MTWRWLDPAVLLAAHGVQIAEHGGGTGIRDRELLDSALARPQHLAAYGDPAPAVSQLAAAYAIGIVRNHPFVDGNKRTGFVAMRLFLELNGYRWFAPDADSVINVLKLAAGDLTDEEFTTWVIESARLT